MSPLTAHQTTHDSPFAVTKESNDLIVSAVMTRSTKKIKRFVYH
jgi:hypothetical protein